MRAALSCLAALAIISPVPTQATPLPPASYHFDQSNAKIQFGLTVAGLLHPKGDFQRFEGELSISPARLADSMISVRLDSNAVEISLPGGAGRLHSADYFDSARFPDITFRSTGLTLQASGHIRIQGVLTIRGIDRIETLDAAPLETPVDSQAPADFVIQGSIARSDFGMVADRPLVSDDIELTIRVSLAPTAARE